MKISERCGEPGCRLNAEHVVVMKDAVTKDLRQVNLCLRHIGDYEHIMLPCVECEGGTEATHIFDGKPVCDGHWNHAFRGLKMKNRYGSDAGRGIETEEAKTMAEKKLPSYRVVLGKATVGTLWASVAKSGTKYHSGFLDLTALRGAVAGEKKTNKQVRVSRDGGTEEHETVRIAMFDAFKPKAGAGSGAGF